MSRLPDHIHISEREADGSWEDCTFDSALEWYRLCIDARKPATHAEAEALRRASGRAMTGGTNLGDFKVGVQKRYGVSLPALVSNRTVLKPGQAMVRTGSMKAFGPTHRLSKWQTNFDAGHAVLEYKDLDGNLFWCDPLAPTNAAVPVRVTQAEADAYAKLFAGSAIVGTIRNITAQEAIMPAIVKPLVGYTANIKPESNLRSAPDIAPSTLVRKTGTAKEAVVVIGTVKGDVDPANGSTEWYEVLAKGVRVYTAKDNVLDLKAPVVGVDDGIDAADVDAAKAAGYAGGKTDGVVIGAANEQARIKAVLGLK